MAQTHEQRWSAETDRVLREAGWYPGREVSTAGWEATLREHGGFEMHEAARAFLAEFGGLASAERGPGKTMARMGFTLDPTVAEWDDEIFDVLSEEAGVDLYPIGEADRRNLYLGMAPNGAVYVGMDSVSWLADAGDEALEKLVEGIR
ncbi:MULTISPECIES: SUKH-3 domain-containing protein [unclassified Streptomyces]|uniref:SUKH-3 domain-containing protein n=1 Tax=unclassified Streptomyces TaxID=2593676 RepID=UPI0007F42A66|nr:MULTISPECIES: SUKH-3 domain-containing protein [unclassified Streptomyces]MCM1970717.1 SUKH-3 domain-containing protein [Streptomyces sp. G1]SBT88599.1 SUKH-3 immunity protein [Streptomyces sp. DI166]